MRVLIACEFSAIVRDAFRDRGHDAWSSDLLSSEGSQRWHFKGDVLALLSVTPDYYYDLIIAHPECTRLTLAGARWYHVPPPGKTLADMEREFLESVKFYRDLRSAALRCAKRVAIENPVMLKRARDAIGITDKRHIIQPWHFGERAIKATGFELFNLPPLKPTKVYTKPRAGTRDYIEWTAVHRAAPGPDRWKERSRTFPGIAAAMAEQWGSL